MEPYQIITIIVAACGVLIAAGGLIVSIVSLRRSSANEAQSKRLREKQEELTELQLKLHRDEVQKIETPNASDKQADIRVSLEGGDKTPKFVIRNWGYSAASDVNLEITPVQGHTSPLVNGDADVKLPIPRLTPGGYCSLLAALSFDTGVVFDVSWSWTEEDGSIRQESSRVSL